MASFGIINEDGTSNFDRDANLPLHDEYKTHINRWHFLINSYMGGDQYRQGQYLTKYAYESGNEYVNRISQTPLDNHVKNVVHIYNSFLFRNQPKRDFGSLENSPEVENFLEDCDMEGRTWESFMRDVNLMSSIYGHCVVLLDRPETAVGTRAEELQQGIRPYATMYTPQNILDWNFSRMSNGHYKLDYVRFLERDDRTYGHDTNLFVRTWTPTEIMLEAFYPNKGKERSKLIEKKANLLGEIPAVWVYANRSPIKGIGISDVNDICDLQNFLYQLYSEAEQLVRISNHPTLVKTPETEASAGAGSIISIPRDTDAGLKPYLLQPNGQNLEQILNTIDSTIKSIDRIAHLGAIRTLATRELSGVAMISEFYLLDSKLAEKAKQLELAEEQIWRIFAKWQGQSFDGKIKYPNQFHIRDKSMDMSILKQITEATKNLLGADEEIAMIVKNKIKEIIANDDDELEELNNINQQQDADSITHPPMTKGNMVQHMREMIKSGMTDEEIRAKHPELGGMLNEDNNQ